MIKAMDNANSFITVDVVVTQITLKHFKNATKNVRTSKKILKVLKPKMTKAFVSYHQPLAIVAQLYQDGILMMNRKNVKSLFGVDAMEMQTISLQNRNVKLDAKTSLQVRKDKMLPKLSLRVHQR